MSSKLIGQLWHEVVAAAAAQWKMTSRGSNLGGGANVNGASVDEYVTPGGYELEKILNRGSVAYTHVNEVWPGVYIGDE